MLTDECPGPGVERRDSDLLRLYVEAQDEDAFAELVSRHIKWVYSAALRQLRDHATAEEATQAVFIALSRKAGSLRRQTVLSGWLFRALRFVVIDMIRAQQRRTVRESECAQMSQKEEALWQEIAPVVDECLAGLREQDQRAILLRFYERKSWDEVANDLGLNENAARMRVDRALIKMRNLLVKCGVTSSASVVGAILFANAVQAAPNINISRNLSPLVNGTLRRFFRREVATVALSGALAAALILAIGSFWRIPLSQMLPMDRLVGQDVFASLKALDRAFYDADAERFLSYLDGADVRDYVSAVAAFRRVGMQRFRNPMFGYYETLDPLLGTAERPTIFGRTGNRATGRFARNRGIRLVRVGGIWKWLLSDIDPGLLERKTATLRELTAALQSDPNLTNTQVLAFFANAK
jgi:RNA polymerase sigma factor (sigma-70 family)